MKINNKPFQTDHLHRSLTEQRDRLRSRDVTSADLTQKYIDRIEEHNPRLNIVIRKNFASALVKAKILDEQINVTNKPIGPLHGVPFTIKDAFRIKGLQTSYGFPGFRVLPAFDSCTIVNRLESAGAVFLGQTNVPLSCFDWQTNSPIYGLTRNPLYMEKTVGGSSGGSAASVAAFFSPFEVGSDVAGSIRYPAHCCGVFGLRPTHGLVPFEDVGPCLHKKSFSNLAVAGPIARSIADMKIVFSVLTAATEETIAKDKLKIAYTLEWSGISPDANCRERIMMFVEKVRVLGHDVAAIHPNIDFDHCMRVWGVILGYEYKRLMPIPLRWRPFVDVFNYFFNTRRFRSGPFKEAFQEGLFAGQRKYQEALDKAEILRVKFQKSLEEFDLWITPVAATEAISHQPTGTVQMLNGEGLDYASYIGNFLMPTTLFHHPILVAPIQDNESEFPIGIQIHGKPHLDWQLLADCEKLNSLFRRS